MVHFPDYKGPGVFPGLPQTWIPIPAVEVRSDKDKSLLRVNLPLRLCWAMTLHKCQGMTAHEGTIISFVGSRMPTPASQPGLPFVGWTRATSWSKVAFHGLPPLEEFLAVRNTKTFKVRGDFERTADVLHDAFVQELGHNEQQQVSDHKKHLDNVLMEEHGRNATEAELKDLEAMLGKRGVAPVSQSVWAWAERKSGTKAAAGLWAIIGAFKGHKKAEDVADKKRKSKAGKKHPDSNLAMMATKTLLAEYNYTERQALEALSACGPSLSKCMTYIEVMQTGHQPEQDMHGIVQEEDWAQTVMVELGFSQEAITTALERYDFNFSMALSFLLYGDQNKKTPAGTYSSHMKRHISKRNVPATNIDGDTRFPQYIERALRDLHFSARVVDLGMDAGETTNACFWLSLAAALAKSSWAPRTYLMNSLRSFSNAMTSPIPSDVQQVRHTSLQAIEEDVKFAQTMSFLSS